MKHESFLTVDAIYRAEVAWWWTDEKLHDVDYSHTVYDSLAEKVRELSDKYDVQEDTRYCCQWEGVQLMGENKSNVELAGRELAKHLARFTGVTSLSNMYRREWAAK